jgi:hypothetical protein
VVGALGWSPWADEVAGATYDEFRIWKGVLTPAELELSHANGPDVIVDPDDTDGDGMRDAWEITHFGGLGQTAAGDFDNDGTSNLDEFRLGLDPDPSDGFTFSWPSQPGLTFRIEASPDLDGWTPLETVYPAEAGSSTTFTDSDPDGLTHYYRVLTNP